MNLGQFLSHAKAENFYSSQRLVCFKGKQTYPLLFFSNYFARMKCFYSGMVEVIDLAMEDNAVIRAKLETSFLGMHSWYWLKNFSDLHEQTKLSWLKYLVNYAGPHSVGFFVQEADTEREKIKGLVVDIPEFVDAPLFLQLATFFTDGGIKKDSFLIDLVKKNKTISLDTACLLGHYGKLLGSREDPLTNLWLFSIIAPERSLFTLSQYFFVKKSKEFFQQWALIMQDYSEVFWVSFWAEQLWRAYYFTKLNRNKQFAEAKKIGFRLPFSYIQREWKHYSLEELQQAHQWLYEIDYSLKNGGDSSSLELFYSKFLTNKFA